MRIILCFALIGLAASELRFLAIGDWGGDGSSDRARQALVAEAMDNYCGQNNCDFIVSTGDNFYDDGVTAPDDPRFDNSWRDVYTGENIRDLVWYISLGNHDHTVIGNNELNQVEFGKTEDKWELPWLWHSWDMQTEGARVHFTVIDSESLMFRKHNVTEQMIWLEDDLVTNWDSDWSIVVAHHPIFSCGRYFGNVAIRDDVLPLMEDYNVDLYLTGHDHNMQHLYRMEDSNVTRGDVDYVISGGGGRRLYEFTPVNENLCNRNGIESISFHEANGFTAISIDRDEMIVEQFGHETDVDGNEVPVLLYTFTRDKVPKKY